jgi:hypothetical protein
LTTSVESYATYTFNTHKIKHRFCPNCGCAPFEDGFDEKGNANVAINTLCLNDMDLTVLKVRNFDGRKL